METMDSVRRSMLVYRLDPIGRSLFVATPDDDFSFRGIDHQRKRNKVTWLDMSSPNSSNTTLGRFRDKDRGDDEVEKGGQRGFGGGGGGPPKPVGFWHPALAATRLSVFKSWAFTTTYLSIFVLCVLSLYWGVLFRVEKNMSKLTVYVVDFDGQVAPYNNGEEPLVGPAIVKAANQVNNLPTPHLGYLFPDISRFNNDPIAVRQAVYDQHAWAAFIINPNATALLRDAVNNGNASYDPQGAAQLIYVEARDPTTVDETILPQLLEFQSQVTASVGKTWTQMVMQNISDSTLQSNLQKVPQALSPAIGFTIFNLRPFIPAVVTPAVSIGLIYLIILAFFSFPFFMPIHSRFTKPDGHPPLNFIQFIIYRWIVTILTYFFISFFYSLVSRAFQIPFSNQPASPVEPANNPNAYGHANFFIYWMLNWVGMTALGLASENMSMALGQPWTALWLIFWVITNVSTSFNALPLAPRFYYWGYAWPLHNIVEASRQILFDLHSRIGLNFGVLFTWCAVNTLLFPICATIFRNKMMKQMKAQQQEQQKK